MAVERVNIEKSGSPWKEEHLSRYLFASAFLKEKTVLDIACGTGFGCELLLDRGAGKVYGVDISGEAVAISTERLNKYGENAIISRGDGTSLSFPGDFFDAITSFETIEHIDHDSKFIYELHRVLKPGGFLFLSTPNAVVTKPGNSFHIREYTPDELVNLISPFFKIVLKAGQSLPEEYGVAPFLPSFSPDALKLNQKINSVYWRILLRLPMLRNPIHQLLFGYSFYPDAGDYTFLQENLYSSHVQYYQLVKK